MNPVVVYSAILVLIWANQIPVTDADMWTGPWWTFVGMHGVSFLLLIIARKMERAP